MNDDENYRSKFIPQKEFSPPEHVTTTSLARGGCRMDDDDAPAAAPNQRQQPVEN